MRKSSAALIISLSWFLAPACVQAQALQPRPAVSAIGRAIAENYYNEDRGAQIASDLGAAAARGEFDDLTDARDLAAALTERLRPLDGHFQVQWAPPSESPASAQSRGDPAEGARRSNFGLRRVEVLPGNIGLIRLDRFYRIGPDDAGSPARTAVDAALQVVAGADALILDLRDNGGGDPSMVGYLASAFLPAGLDAYNVFLTRDGSLPERPVRTYREPRTRLPLFILVSGRSASAAEGLSYTLQAAKRATIIGQATAGAANPGGPVQTGDGLSIFVPFATPRNPITGANWEGGGVTPDVAVDESRTFEAAYGRALAAAIGQRGEGVGSADARWALESLSAPAATVPMADYAGDYGSANVQVTTDGLLYRYLRRPARTLRALAVDLFFDLEDPTRRTRFVRDASGAVVALELLGPDGEVVRRRKTDGREPGPHTTAGRPGDEDSGQPVASGSRQQAA